MKLQTQKCPVCAREVWILARDPLGAHARGVCGWCVTTRKESF